MDSLDLLAREDEFKKLNKQLEKKTESLMKEIENVMQKQDFFSDFSHNLTFTPTHKPKKHLCTTQTQNQTIPPKPIETKRKKSPKNVMINESKNIQTENDGCNDNDDCHRRVVCECCSGTKSYRRNDNSEFLEAFVSVSVQDKVLPQSFLKDNISLESVCKFLSSKIKLMQEQIDKLQDTLDKKAIQCKAHMTQYAELVGERMSLLNSNNSLKASAADAKVKYMAAEQRLAEKDRLYKEQRSECDRLTCELKKLRSENISLCSRNAAQEDTISNLTQQLKSIKAEHLEFRDSTRSLSASNQATIANLEARVKALTATIDKQTSLIDNLRKQNAVLATEGALRALEKDYCNFLNQDL